MALQRIIFRNRDASGSYTCPINPRRVELHDNVDYSKLDVIDGSAVRLTSNFDNRVRRLEWDRFPSDNTVYSAMITELKSYKGAEKELDLKTIDLNNYGFKDILVLDVGINIPEGGDLLAPMYLDFIYTESL